MSRTSRCIALAAATLVGACADAPTSVGPRHVPETQPNLAFNPNAYTPFLLQIDEPRAMNDAGAIVGRRNGDKEGYYQLGTYLWRLTRPSDATSVHLTGINNRGNIIAIVTKPHFVSRAVYWNDYRAVPVQLPSFGHNIDAPYGINDNGVVVGRSWNSAGVAQAFEWWPGLGSLQSIGGSARSTTATDIGNQGNASGFIEINGVTYPWARFGGAPIALASRPNVKGLSVTPRGAVILSNGEVWSSHLPPSRPTSGSFLLRRVSANGRFIGEQASFVNGVAVTTAHTSFNGIETTLRYPGETSSEAIAVTACGSVLARVSMSGVNRGVLWSKMTCDIGTPTI